MATPKLLELPLPGDVLEKKWDIILVDAPGGWNDETPGRMQSIYMSSKLIKTKGEIFVHDCEREIEDIYCNKYLKVENLIQEIKTFKGNRFLRHYQMMNNTR